MKAHELDPGLLSATETDRQGRELSMRLGVAFFAMMNVMLLSIAVWAGADWMNARHVPLDFRADCDLDRRSSRASRFSVRPGPR